MTMCLGKLYPANDYDDAFLHTISTNENALPLFFYSFGETMIGV